MGANESSHTAQSRLLPIIEDDRNNPSLQELEDAFNIETVTKEFFTKYRKLYEDLKDELDRIVEKDARIKADFDQKNVSTVDFAKKLLGQIVFLYFLQKKGWFGVKRGQEWGTGSKHFLRELFNKVHSDYTNFFDDIMEPLFYEALRNDRSYDDHYFSMFKCKIPFLNGGLFDPIGDYDWKDTDILLPNELFSNRIKTKEGDTGTGILDVFDRYNFTVKEDEPLEKEVAVDPEMLGKVFENLLEVKDRKSKGTYYTPREIVHYMCQESLINYLCTACNDSAKSYQKLGVPQTQVFGNEALKKGAAQELYIEDPTGAAIPREDLEELIKHGEEYVEHDRRVVEAGRETRDYPFRMPESVRQNAKLIDEKLSAILVCDPAVGSGAFPVGMMNEIIRARTALTNYIIPPRRGGQTFLSDNVANRGGQTLLSDQATDRQECLSSTEERRTPYDFKRHAIQNCLYGVDLDPGAVEIAKLRLWLSLIVDEEDIKKIKPLPNLDYKIVQGNSLLGVEKNLFNQQLFNQLEELKPKFFEETNAKRKQALKNQIDELIGKITNGRKDFDFEVYFSEVFHAKKGFDVVIGNPPYIRQEELKPIKHLLERQNYQVYNSTSDIYTYFYEKGWLILNSQGHLAFISSNKWMRAKYGEKLRNFFLEKTALKQIIDFNGYKVFEATVDTSIILFRKAAGLHHKAKILNIGVDFTQDTQIHSYFSEKAFDVVQSTLDPKCFAFGNDKIMSLKKKIESAGIPLKDWDVQIYRGVVTGFNEAFIIDTATKERLCQEDPRSAEILKPVLRGRDIQRYYHKWAGLWLICTFPTLKLRIDDYPAIKNHLLYFGKNRLEQSGLEGARKKTGNRWFETQDNIAYYAQFEKEKIVWAETIKEYFDGSRNFPRFAFNSQKHYLDKTSFMIFGSNLRFIIAVLNSRVLETYLRSIVVLLGPGSMGLSKVYIEQAPIPNISEKEQQPFTTLVDKILAITKDDDYLKNPAKQAQVKEYERQIDLLVYELYGLTEEEIKVVEGRESKK